MFTGVKIQMTSVLTFNKCLQLGLGEHSEYMTQLSDDAAKEHVIEQALDKMENEWEAITMEVTPHKNTGMLQCKVPVCDKIYYFRVKNLYLDARTKFANVLNYNISEVVQVIVNVEYRDDTVSYTHLDVYKRQDK